MTGRDPVAKSRIVAISLALVGWTFVAAPAHACDSNYPWLCPPVPSIDPPAEAEPAKAKPAKPLPVTNRRAANAAKAVSGKATAAAAARKSAARKAAMRRFAARARTKTVVASRAVEAAATRAD